MSEPMTYSTYAFCLGRLGRNTGLEDKLTSYCFRRGTTNAIDSIYIYVMYTLFRLTAMS
jgi:hypothetical protein